MGKSYSVSEPSKSEYKEIRVSEITDELIERISKRLSHYLVGILRIEERETSEDVSLIGSGTLIQIDNVYGILTAHHVAKALSSKGEIGLVLSTQVHHVAKALSSKGEIGLVLSTQVNKPRLDLQTLRIIEVGRGDIPSEGPDLAVIILPQGPLGTIKALKSFYNLSFKRDKILTKPLPNDIGIWFLCGFIDERTIEKRHTQGFDTLKGFYAQFSASGIEKEYTSQDYDYLKTVAHYKPERDLPMSFGGTSGGGLWQVPLLGSAKGELEIKEMILSGVAFYQSEKKNNMRKIKCHGRQSIYKTAYEFIKKECQQ